MGDQFFVKIKPLKKLLIILLIAAAVTELAADPVLSGSINTVNPGSSFNALRNPALMRGERENTQGLIFLSSHDLDINFAGDIDLLAFNDEQLSVKSEEKLNLSFFFSSVHHYGRGSFGFGIKQNSSNQFLLSSSETVMTAADPSFLESISKEDKMEAGLGLVFSYAFNVRRNEALGFFIENNYYYKTLTKKIQVYTPALVSDRDFESEIRGVSFIPGLGLHVAGNRDEAGIILKMGEIMFETQDYTVSDSVPVTSDRENIPLFHYFNRGPEVLAGYSRRTGKDITLSVEAGFMFPFQKKEVKRSDDNLINENSYTNLKRGYSLGGALDIDFSRDINFSTGLVYFSIKNQSYNKDGIRSGDSDFSVIQLSSGMEYNISEELNLLFGAGVYRVDADFSTNLSNKLNISAESTYVNLSAGLSRNY